MIGSGQSPLLPLSLLDKRTSAVLENTVAGA